MTELSAAKSDAIILAVCRQLLPVLAPAAARLGDVQLAEFEPVCDRQFVRWAELGQRLNLRGSNVVVLGGPCLAPLAANRHEPPGEYAGWWLRAYDSCAEAVLGNEVVALLRSVGLEPVVAGAPDGNVAGREKLVLAAGDGSIVEGGRSLNPVEAGAERHLAGVIAERRTKLRLARMSDMLANAYRQVTDKTLTVECIGELADMLIEERAIGRFFDLLTLLMGPRRMVYLGLEDGQPGIFAARPPGSYNEDEARARLAGFEHTLEWDGEVRLRMALKHRGRVVGAVECDSIGQPERRADVIDLVLTAARVAGLAVSNARLYRDLTGPKDRHAISPSEDLKDALAARKRAEERQAQLTRELEEVNRELSQFAWVVSHDLKAPLRGVDSLAQWLATDFGDRLGPEATEHLRLMREQVARMRRLIDGILEYSRAGRSREARTAVDLSVLVPETIAMLAPPPQITITVMPGLPVVTAERTRIEQVFANLLSNAIKYIDKPAGRVEVGFDDAGEYWRFWVRDNGPGIKPEDQERIFGLFQTGQPREAVDSTGIGLAVVKRVVTMFGGRVWVESTPGAGATFYFTWPKQLPEAAAGPEKRPQGGGSDE